MKHEAHTHAQHQPKDNHGHFLRIQIGDKFDRERWNSARFTTAHSSKRLFQAIECTGPNNGSNNTAQVTSNLDEHHTTLAYISY